MESTSKDDIVTMVDVLQEEKGNFQKNLKFKKMKNFNFF